MTMESTTERCLSCGVSDAWDGDRWLDGFCLHCAPRWPEPIRIAAIDGRAAQANEQPSGRRYWLRCDGTEPIEFAAAYIEGDWVLVIGSGKRWWVAHRSIISCGFYGSR